MSSASFWVKGRAATARLYAAWYRAVAISCIVRVILRMLRIDFRRLTRTRRLAMASGGLLLRQPGVLEVGQHLEQLLGERFRQVARLAHFVEDLGELVAYVREHVGLERQH